MHCEFPENNASDEEIEKILRKYHTVAVVGLSADEEKPSYMVAKYLKEHGYKIIPVNPKYDEILGEKSYPDLKSIPEEVEIVDIFRKPDAVEQIVDDAVEIGAKVIWMQLGICNNKAAEKARENDLKVVMNKCMKVEHSIL